MEFIIVIIICVIAIILLKFGLNVSIKDIKKIKQIGYDRTLNAIAEKFPNNKEICIEILNKLNNKNVKIEENNESKTSLYIALSNKIIIADIKDTFTRIQTIAHECLHSVQNRQILMFNFVFSNIFLLWFIVALCLIIFNVGTSIVYIQIFAILALIYCTVRCYLENEAMSRAMYVAKEYMCYQANRDKNITEEDIKILVENFEVLNKIGIPLTNFSIVSGNLLKIVVLCIFALI